jgi:peroxiredoxin
MKFIQAILLGVLAATGASAVKVGDSIPSDLELHYGFPPERINIGARVAGKKVILVGLPGAFTPTCSGQQVPGYLSNMDALKKLGIDEVIIYCVNDGAVMQAWAENQGVKEEGIVTLMGDPYGQLTEKLDMELIAAGPKLKGLVDRSKRHALYVVDGVVKIVRVAESDDDPAGDDFPDITLAEAMMDAIKKLGGGSDEL